MQKKLRSLLALASFVAATAIFFIACGDGEMIELDSGKVELLDTAGDILLGDKIEGIKSSVREMSAPAMSSSEQEDPQSSSSQQATQSSSSNDDGGDPPSSSSRASQPSSSSQASTPSSSSKPASSSSKAPTPPPATGDCIEENPKSGFNCAWNVTGTLTPGTTLKPAAYTLPSGCTAVDWKFAPDTSRMVLMAACESTDDNGFKAEGSNTYVLFAKLTCSDGTHTNACNPKTGLSSKRSPELQGECEWEKNPTTTARGGTPKKANIKIVDPDNICTGGKVVYKYDGGSKTWPESGILSEWAGWKRPQSQTYSDIEATLSCSSFSQPVKTACPALKVDAGSDHIIECTGDWNAAACGGAGKNSATLKMDECVEINVLGLDKAHQNGIELVMRCQAAGNENEANVSYTLSLNGGTGTKCTGSYSCNNTISIGKTHLGDNEFGTLCLTQLAGKSSVKCDFGQ